MSTLREIAEETGLAIGTVSRILRGRQRVAEDTKKRVFEVADRLKYRPNMLIKGIQTGKTQTIGVEMRLGSDGFRAEILCGIMDELLKADYVAILVSRDNDDSTSQLDRIHSLVDRRVDGVILYPELDTRPDDYLKEVWDRGIPLTTTDRIMAQTHADFVGTDDVMGGRLAAGFLLQLGHRNILHLAGPQHVTTAMDRRKGFDDEIAGEPDASVKTVEADWMGAPSVLREFLGSGERPSAIFCDSDMMAVGVYAVAVELGLRIPEDLCVIGYGDLLAAKGLLPALTTVKQSPYDIGRRAARQVLDRIEKKCVAEEPVRIRLEPELVVRASTGAAPS